MTGEIHLRKNIAQRVASVKQTNKAKQNEKGRHLLSAVVWGIYLPSNLFFSF
jgi:hypothetical protein